MTQNGIQVEKRYELDGRRFVNLARSETWHTSQGCGAADL